MTRRQVQIGVGGPLFTYGKGTLARFKGPGEPVWTASTQERSDVTDLVVSPSGKRLALCGYGGIEVFDAETGTSVVKLDRPRGKKRRR